jgi:hypothetical protein
MVMGQGYKEDSLGGLVRGKREYWGMKKIKI